MGFGSNLQGSWLPEGGSVPMPGTMQFRNSMSEGESDSWHPWLTDLRAMARLLRGELTPPHLRTHRGDVRSVLPCEPCENAERLQAEARPVADVDVLVDGDDYIGDVIVRIDQGKTTVTRRLVLCSHGHLFTPCEWCEYDKQRDGSSVVSYIVFME